ncbi:MAG: undecaprenyl-diphosphate phosphatase [Thermoproteota archaeon]|nr:undecaprenyl-diphosphate phosphatase [Thermoproteota archaeon]
MGVIGFYRKEIQNILKSLFYPCSMDVDSIKEYRQLLILIIVGTIPTAIIAFGLRSLFEYSFYDFFLLSIGFFISGIFLWVSRYFKAGNKELGIVDSIIIGIAQGFSVFSSISRSGITISIGMIRKVDHHKLVRYSFLLSIPAIFGASIFDFLLMDERSFLEIGKIGIFSYLVGIISSAIVGYLSIKLLINIINKGSFYYFSYYCLVLGAILLIISFVF